MSAATTRSKYYQRSPRIDTPTPLANVRQSRYGQQYLLTGYFRRFAESYSFFRAYAGGVVGENAFRAIELARAERDADEKGLVVVWEMDTYGEIDWCTDSASAVNRCEHEHDWPSRHVITGRVWARREDKHADGTLESRCAYAREVELWSAVVMKMCEQCREQTVWNDRCRDCTRLDSLHGIDTPSDEYRRVVEAELLAGVIGGYL